MSVRLLDALRVVQSGDPRGLTAALVGVPINAPVDEKGWTLLHHNVSYGDVGVTRVLLEDSRLDINSTTKAGCTALQMAVDRGFIDVVPLLLGVPGIDIHVQYGGECNDVFTLVADRGFLHLMAMLVERVHESQVPWFRMMKVALNGWRYNHHSTEDPVRLMPGVPRRRDFVDRMGTVDFIFKRLNAEERVAAVEESYMYRDDGRRIFMFVTLLHEESNLTRVGERSPHALDIVKSGDPRGLSAALLNISINAPVNIIGWTLLHHNANYGDVGVTRVLLEDSRLDINATTSKGCTALQMAVDRGFIDVVLLLLDVPGIDFHTQYVQYGEKWDVFRLAANRGFLHLMTLLVERVHGSTVPWFQMMKHALNGWRCGHSTKDPVRVMPDVPRRRDFVDRMGTVDFIFKHLDYEERVAAVRESSVYTEQKPQIFGFVSLLHYSETAVLDLSKLPLIVSHTPVICDMIKQGGIVSLELNACRLFKENKFTDASLAAISQAIVGSRLLTFSFNEPVSNEARLKLEANWQTVFTDIAHIVTLISNLPLPLCVQVEIGAMAFHDRIIQCGRGRYGRAKRLLGFLLGRVKTKKMKLF